MCYIIQFQFRGISCTWTVQNISRVTPVPSAHRRTLQGQVYTVLLHSEYVSMGSWWWGQTQAIILVSLPLRAAPRLSGVDGNTHTSVHKVWFRSFYIQRGTTHSGKVKITPIYAIFFNSLLHGSDAAKAVHRNLF